jgi:hypothetical protein
MKTISITVYEYDELSPKAQEKARDWYREASAGDNDFADSVIEDVEQIAPLMGIDFALRDVRTVGGKTFQEPCIFYSGFSSQGDGACFEGTWRASDVKPGEVAAYAPKDETLHAIAAEFERISKEFPQATFSTKHRGNYYHEGCVEFDFNTLPDYDGVLDPADEKRIETAEGALKEAARDFMKWIYRQLEAAYDYEQSDENVAEAIRANDYEFTAEGKRSIVI